MKNFKINLPKWSLVILVIITTIFVYADDYITYQQFTQVLESAQVSILENDFRKLEKMPQLNPKMVPFSRHIEQ